MREQSWAEGRRNARPAVRGLRPRGFQGYNVEHRAVPGQDYGFSLASNEQALLASLEDPFEQLPKLEPLALSLNVLFQVDRLAVDHALRILNEEPVGPLAPVLA